jgi:hypothetical protein
MEKQDDGNVGFDGAFNPRELARHVSDALSGKPRQRFNELLVELRTAAEAEADMTEFEKIWEREGRWISGPGLLATIVEYLRGKSVVASLNESQVNIGLPLPQVINEVDGEPAPIYLLVPEELRDEFARRCNLILASRANDADKISNTYLHTLSSPLALAQINNDLTLFEHERRAAGRGELWEIAAETFGLRPYALPRPLFSVAGLIK